MFDALDRRVSEALLVRPRADGTPRGWLFLLRRFSEAGSYGIGWIVLFAVVGVLSDGIVRGLVAAGCVVGMLLLNTAIKRIFRRARPRLRALDHAPNSYSMPSAHTSMAMVGAATMTQIVPELTPLWWAIAFGLAVSRVMLGMHYVGDVVAGALVGIAAGLAIAVPLVASVG